MARTKTRPIKDRATKSHKILPKPEKKYIVIGEEDDKAEVVKNAPVGAIITRITPNLEGVESYEVKEDQNKKGMFIKQAKRISSENSYEMASDRSSLKSSEGGKSRRRKSRKSRKSRKTRKSLYNWL